MLLKIIVFLKEFDDFYKRFDTFSLGVCNGCQVMSNLGYLGGDIKLVENKSGKFESRFNLVKIEKVIVFSYLVWKV